MRNRFGGPDRRPHLAAVGVAVVAIAAAVVAVPLVSTGPGAANSTAPGTSQTEVALARGSDPAAATLTTTEPAPTLSGSPTASPVDAPTPPPTAGPTAAPTSTPEPTLEPTPPAVDHPWRQDAVLLAARAAGRVVVRSGKAVWLDTPPSPVAYPSAAALPTAWTRLIQEPPRSGRDDAGRAYVDDNYTLLCGPGAAAVTLYYWAASTGAVTRTAGWFVEPVKLATTRYARTYWRAESAAGYGRGMIMTLAEQEWPTPDKGLSWWKSPGLMNWSLRPPATEIWTLSDAINWEASGRTSVSYYYVVTAASDLTLAALQAHVRADINAGVPVVIAARTADGHVALPYWRVTSQTRAVNHFVTVVGYDDAAGTFTVMDTCGVGCNNRGIRGGLGTIGQAALFELIQAESDNDGIIW